MRVGWYQCPLNWTLAALCFATGYRTLKPFPCYPRDTSFRNTVHFGLGFLWYLTTPAEQTFSAFPLTGLEMVRRHGNTFCERRNCLLIHIRSILIWCKMIFEAWLCTTSWNELVELLAPEKEALSRIGVSVNPRAGWIWRWENVDPCR